MKFFNMLIPFVLVTAGVGCQCDEGRTVSRTSTTTQQQVTRATPEPVAPMASVPSDAKPLSVQQVVTDKATYTIEVLPNPPRLTPTSREGDKPDRVYSSNIIAVYVRTNSGSTVGSTNVIGVPDPANNP